MRTAFLIFVQAIALFVFFSAANAATYVVDRADDLAGATACTAAANDCSLRGAIINANANGVGLDTINFSIGGGNFQSITISATQMPTIQTSLVIDGSTQPLWGGPPIIEINGAANAFTGFRVASPSVGTPLDVTFKSLIINRFGGYGIQFDSSSLTGTVVGCYIGTDPGGSQDRGNNLSGIKLLLISDEDFTIGGTQSFERNVVSGNNVNGIEIESNFSFGNTFANVLILNNFVGTNAAGTTALANGFEGIDIYGTGAGDTVQIGNGLANGRNVISGNGVNGIRATTGNLSILGNHIGASLNGNVDVGNSQSGIKLDGDFVNATIGGTILGIPVGNVISGNGSHGIEIADVDVDATIRTNRIGTNSAGTAALGNTGDGIALREFSAAGSSDVIIGSGSDPNDGNTISGNGGDGIAITAMFGSVEIYANKIGVNSAATAAIPNAIAGIRIQSPGNDIGLAGNSGAGNIISGNLGDGVMLVTASSVGNKLYGNFIGTNSTGAALGNNSDGIYVNQSSISNIIGDNAGSGNTIAFNTANGINLADGQAAIRGNSIYSNGELGIEIGATGPDTNDPGDTDGGANGRQNYPVILTATPSRVTGTINSIPNIQYRLDFFSNTACDASGHGEGRTFLGTGLITTSINGTASWIYSNQFAINAGEFITATATDNQGNTSEFSQCKLATPPLGDVTFSATSYTTAESAGNRTIVVNRTGGSFGTIAVDYYTFANGATAGQDYISALGTLTFLNGEVVKSFNVSITNDTTDEFDEEFLVVLHNQSEGVLITNNESPVTIIDDDAPPSIQLEDVSQFEGNQGNLPFSVRVSLSQASGKPITVDYAAVSGTATLNTDFLPANGTITFNPGDTLKNAVVDVIGDLTTELDETFFVDFSNPQNVSLPDTQALGTIKDDDNPGRFSFSFAPYSGTEHDSVTVTVSRTNGAAGTVSVDFATGGGNALPVEDYTPVAGTLVFLDGETTKTFDISLADDAIAEPSETFNVMLSNPIGGATLATPSVAAVNITDNDDGQLLTLAGVVRLADSTPVGGVAMTLQGSQTASVMTDSNGRFSFANLAPNGNYTITPSALGYTFAPLSQEFANLAADNLGVNFTATPAPSRQLRVIGGNATPGQDVTATVELVAQGDENSAGFSLNFDSAVLTNPSAVLASGAPGAFLTTNSSQTGKLGVLIALPAGQSFTAGVKSLVTVTFTTLPTALYNSPVTFGDAPIAREVADSLANTLPTNYLDGAVTFAQGYESDVAPRPTGNNNGTITITDFTQVGRFVAGLDTLNPAFNEFQRADSAPRVTLGNGILSVADYTQAGRYAASLDAVNPTGGAAAANLLVLNEPAKILGGETVVRVVNNQSTPGGTVTIAIEADTQGIENGFGFTLNYDAAKLGSPVVARGADTQSGTLIPNVSQPGKVGVVLGMPFGVAVPAGTRQIVTVQFNVAANAAGGMTPLAFSDTPVVREISDVDANVVNSTFTDGTLNIIGPTAADAIVAGRVTDSAGNGLARVQMTLTDAGGQTRVATTNSFGRYRFADIATGQSYILSVSAKRYRFDEPSRVVNVQESLEEVDFVSRN